MATSKLTKAESMYIKELEKQSLLSMGIKKDGDAIVIPSFSEIPDVIDVLQRANKSLDDEVQILIEFDCNPNDGLHAFVMAQREVFGEIQSVESTQSFFGMEFNEPGHNMTIAIDYGETMTVPVGRVQVFGLPIIMDVRPQYDERDANGGKLSVIFNAKRKFESLIRRIESNTRKYLMQHPLYKGKAIDSRYDFLDISSFDATKIVYTKSEELDIKSSILLPITHEAEWKAMGNYQRRGIVLAGEYGTGKTLTARYIAQVAVENGWTFINVLPGDDIVTALRFARRYEPAVVFVEDIDAETKGERTKRINEILNTVDGVVNKDSKIMLVLTTNHPDDIQPGMLRPGRVDNLITLGKLDQETLVRMVIRLSQSTEGEVLLSDTPDGERLMAAATVMIQGQPRVMTPAFIAEAVSRAKAYALVRGDTSGLICSADVEYALMGIQSQFGLVAGERKEVVPTLEKSLYSLVKQASMDSQN